MNCAICGAKLRSHNRTGVCRKHGTGSFDLLTGKCRVCGKVVSAKARGFHASSKCETATGPWNKGLTARTSRSLRRGAKARVGQKRPGVSKKIRAAWKDPEKRARYVEGITRGQRKRFESPTERGKSSRRARKMIREGKVVPFGGRKHGCGGLPTKSELEMLRRLGSLEFVPNYPVSTGTRRPTHYKIDLAHVEKKLAVELDGTSHTLARREGSDARKDSFLRSIGWKVLRFREPCDLNRVFEEVIREFGAP